MHELNDSGAMARNAGRWQTERYFSDGQEILDFAAWRQDIVDRAIALITGTEGEVPFLSATGYEQKGGPIFGDTAQAEEDRSDADWDEGDAQ